GTVQESGLDVAYLALDVPNLSADVSDYNFGLEQLPEAIDNVVPATPNPGGGFVELAVNSFFLPEDPDGSVDSIILFGLPDNVETLVIGTDTYSVDFGALTIPYTN